MSKAARRDLCVRGFRDQRRVGDTTTILPESPSPNASEYAKRNVHKDFGHRSAIEPVIGHFTSGWPTTNSKAHLAVR